MRRNDKPKVLSVAGKGERLAAREEAFGEAGFHVESAKTCKQAIALINRGHHDVLVVSVGVDEQERNRLAAIFKSKNAAGQVVFLYRGSIQNAEVADALLSILNPPADLAQAIYEQIGRRTAG